MHDVYNLLAINNLLVINNLLAINNLFAINNLLAINNLPREECLNRMPSKEECLSFIHGIQSRPFGVCFFWLARHGRALAGEKFLLLDLCFGRFVTKITQMLRFSHKEFCLCVQIERKIYLKHAKHQF